MPDIQLSFTGAQLDEAVTKVLNGYKDVTNVTATANHVLEGQIIVDSSGEEVEGTILLKESETITPSESEQVIEAGQYLNGDQTIAPIPSQYKDISGVTATANDVLSPKVIIDSNGVSQVGSISDQSNTTHDVVAENDSVNGYINFPIPINAYYDVLSKLCESYSDIAELIGLTPDKILVGNTILGVVGEAEGGGGGGEDLTNAIMCIEGSSANLTIPNGVTALRDYLFYRNYILELINLPDGILTIGESAFDGCELLANTTLPDSITLIKDYAFYGCYELALTSLPSNLESIGISAFEDCSNLAIVSFPAGLQTIGDDAFSYCENITPTTMPDSVISLGANAFYGCSLMPLESLSDSLTTIENNTFYNCTELALTSLPENITSIGSSAFKNCINLALTALPEGITIIYSNTFYGCSSLSLTSLPTTLTTIESSAFNGCVGMHKLWIPSSVQTIQASVLSAAPFLNCSPNLVMFIEASSPPAGWSSNWDKYASGQSFLTFTGVSKADFEATYIWDKYNATASETYSQTRTDNHSISIPFTGNYKMGTGVTFNENNGTYTISPTTTISATTDPSAMVGQYISGMAGSGFSVIEIYYVKSAVKNMETSKFDCTTIKCSRIKFIKGDMIVDSTVTSMNATEYPLDNYDSNEQVWYTRRP